jgi:uncharacterized protein YecE (DUF72 family)
MPGRLHLGTSGFAYPEWKGVFYPADIRSDGMLRFYAERFPSVEINYTFQRNCSEKTLEKWIAETPAGFVFSLKAHRSITHTKRLSEEAAGPLSTFFTSIAPLGERTGAILFQCPPNLKADVPRLESFLAMLPDGRRYAFEFRHGTWMDDAVYSSLQGRRCAWCVADTDEADAPFVRTTPSFTYLRLRKTTYDEEALSRWAKQITEALEDGSDVYCYLKHEEEGRGVYYARALSSLLQSPS